MLTGKRVELRADASRPVPVGGDGEPLGQLPALGGRAGRGRGAAGRAGGHRLSRARARADRFGQTAQVETRTGAAPTWRESFDSLVTSEPRSVEEWSRLAALAYLTRPEGWDDWSARAVEACLDAGAGPAAARCAFWLGFGLLDEGRAGRGAGWLARADELLGDVDCAERGLLLTPVALGLLESGDAATALERFIEIVELGERHDDADVATIGRLGRGQALVELGDRDRGVALVGPGHGRGPVRHALAAGCGPGHLRCDRHLPTAARGHAGPGVGLRAEHVVRRPLRPRPLPRPVPGPPRRGAADARFLAGGDRRGGGSVHLARRGAGGGRRVVRARRAAPAPRRARGRRGGLPARIPGGPRPAARPRVPAAGAG